MWISFLTCTYFDVLNNVTFLYCFILFIFYSHNKMVGNYNVVDMFPGELNITWVGLFSGVYLKRRSRSVETVVVLSLVLPGVAQLSRVLSIHCFHWTTKLK